MGLYFMDFIDKITDKFEKEKKYKEALQYEEDGSTALANRIFRKLGDYKDCENRLAENEEKYKYSKYKHAAAVIENNSDPYLVATATEDLLSIADYRDSKEIIEHARELYAETFYSKIMELLDTDYISAEDYNKFYLYYSVMGKYKDSEDVVKEKLEVLIPKTNKQNDYEAAKRALLTTNRNKLMFVIKIMEEIGDYKDSKEISETAKKQLERIPDEYTSEEDEEKLRRYEKKEEIKEIVSNLLFFIFAFVLGIILGIFFI